MHPGCVRLIELCAWMGTAMMGLLALSQAFGVTALPAVFVVQAVTPWVLAPAFALAALALWRRRHVLALTNIAIALALLWLSAPIVFHASPAVAGASATRVSIAHANVYVHTTQPDEAAATLLALGADVVAITEYSDAFEAALVAHGVDTTYPYRSGIAPGDRDGVALLSRYPITASTVAPIGHRLGIDATIDIDGVALRVVVVHPLPGIDAVSLDEWTDDLPTIGDVAVRPGPPTVVIGDFNASRWHPAFRHLLDRGLVDVHEALGKGWSRSWPLDTFGPAFVRIDHMLLGTGITPESVVDVEIPGSDHAGFVTTIAVTPDP